jgi:hypothetical protein
VDVLGQLRLGLVEVVGDEVRDLTACSEEKTF